MKFIAFQAANETYCVKADPNQDSAIPIPDIVVRSIPSAGLAYDISQALQEAFSQGREEHAAQLRGLLGVPRK